MNRFYFTRTFIILLTSILASSCAFNTKKDSKIEVTAPNTTGKETSPSPTIPGTFQSSTSSIEAKLAAAQEGTSNVAEIMFEKGASRLSPANQKCIEDAVATARAKGKLSHASVVAWSDSEMPKKEDQDLSQDQVKLAQTRGQTVQHYLESHYKGMGVDIVNMGKSSSSLGKFFKSDNVRIKEALRSAAGSDPKAGHVIVILEPDQK